MPKEDLIEDLMTIAGHYGLEAQLVQTAEECSELAQAALKYRRMRKTSSVGKFNKAWANLIEEIADVEIMIYQIVNLLQLRNAVDAAIKAKVSRQLKRIEQEAQDE